MDHTSPIVLWYQILPLLTPVIKRKVLHITLSGYIIEVNIDYHEGEPDMNYKALRLKVDNHLYYKVVGYAERERRSINNSVEYILQRYFEEHPLDGDEE